MITITMLRAVLLAVLAGVQGLSVVSAGDRTHVIIETDGDVTYEHQMLTSPPRIVVDLAGAEFDLPQNRFLDINRGGVLALRSSQFQPGVVRVVVDLAEGVDYEVQRVQGAVRISFPNPAGPFEPWSSGPPARAAAAEPEAPAPEPVAPRATPDPEPMGLPVADPPVEPRPAPVEPRPVPVERRPAPVDRRTEAVPVSRPPIIEAQAPQQPSITVEFRNTPITDVLGTFADFADRSIVPGTGVTNQTITAAIRDQPWDEALRAILAGQGLTATELASGIIMVTSLEQQRALETQEPMVTEAFQLQYVSADSMAPQVERLLSQGDQQAMGNVAVNRATNSVIVSGRQSVVSGLREFLAGQDQPTPQVTVQVRILSVNRTAFEGLGVRYELKDSHGTALNRLTFGREGEDGSDGGLQQGPQVNLSGPAIAAVGSAVTPLPNATFEVISSLLLGRFALITWIDAVERLELQADPVITVLDNRTARIHVGERVPIRVVDQGAASEQGPQAQVNTEETGVIVELTPRIVGTNQVNINLHAERSAVTTASVDEGYRFSTEETDTEILLNDGQTAVISGLTTKNLTNTIQGIPILMHLPLVGPLFRTTLQQEEKRDLLIMVTPFIDRSGGF